MKSLYITIGIILSSVVHAQIIIGTGKTNTSSPAISLEFGTENKGIIIPWVTSTNDMGSVSPGTFVLDVTDRVVKFKLQNEWMALSQKAVDPIDTSIQNGLTESPNAKTIIGASTSTAEGILILEDSYKAMQLPMVESPHLNIINPAPGMLAYDTKTNLVCIYNGYEWSFWKPID